MNTRCTAAARVAAFLLMAAALFMASTATQAQVIDCSQCDHFTFAVNARMECAVEICYTPSPLGPIVCKKVNPGESVRIPCSVYQAWVNTCSGRYYLIPSTHIALCSPELKFAVGCCGKICNVPSPDVCTRIEVQPEPCASLSCP